MTDQTTPAAAGAQPIADANSVESILNSANPPANEEPKPEAATETPEAEADEPNESTEVKAEEQFPKKAVNALSRRDKQIGKLRAELAAERAAKQAIEQQYKTQTPSAKPTNTGEPQEKDFNNYHDYIRAVNRYDAEQLLNARDGKQKESQQTQQEQAWVAERESAVAKQAQEFLKENPEAAQLIEEHADVIDELPPQIQRLFLEADNASLAFFNLAKEGKLETLGSMSLAKAAMEIGRAQTQAAIKPKTKAPTPLPASRGSVPAGKSLDKLSAREAWQLLNPKD